MTKRNTRIAVSEEELAELKQFKEERFGQFAENIPHGAAITELIGCIREGDN